MLSLLLATTAPAAPPPPGVEAHDVAPEGAERWEGFTPLGPTTWGAWTAPPTSALAGSWPDALAGDGLRGGVLALEPHEEVRHVFVLLADLASEAHLRVGDRSVDLSGETWSALRSSPTLTPERPSLRRGASAWDRLIAPLLPWHELVLPPGERDLAVEGAALAAVVIAPRSALEATRAWLHDVDATRRRAFEASRVVLPGALATGATEDMPLSVLLTAIDEPPVAFASQGAPSGWRVALEPGTPLRLVLWCYPDDRPVVPAIEGLDDLQVTWQELVWADALAQPGDPGPFAPRWLAPVDEAARGGQGVPVALVLTLEATAETRSGRHQGTVVLTRAPEVVRAPLRVDVGPSDLPPPLPVAIHTSVLAPDLPLPHPLVPLQGLAPGGWVRQVQPLAVAPWWASIDGAAGVAILPSPAPLDGSPSRRPLLMAMPEGPWVSLAAVRLAEAAEATRWLSLLRTRAAQEGLPPRYADARDRALDLLRVLTEAADARRPDAPWPPEALRDARDAVQEAAKALPATSDSPRSPDP